MRFSDWSSDVCASDLLPPNSGGFPMTHLKHADLLRRQAYIDGAWVGADSGRTFPVTNPADGRLIAEAPDSGRSEERTGGNAWCRTFRAWREAEHVKKQIQ